MSQNVKTFCRVCEPACGLIAEVEDGKLLSLKGDKDHPITKGFVCHKGIYGADIHNDPDRLNHPLKRKADGSFEQIGWDEALAEIASKLCAIIGTGSSNSVASYRGNPMAFNTMFWASYASFTGQVGIDRIFSSGTQDCTNKLAASGILFGDQAIHPLPDIDNTDFLLMIGENPAVSHMSFMSIADPVAKLASIEDRGGKVVFINPRRIETERHVGEVVQIKPDTDVYLFAAILHEIHRITGFDCADTGRHAAGLEKLAEFVQDYSPESVSPVTGIAPDVITDLAKYFCDDGIKASIHMSTGVNMGRQGTAAYWLLQMIAFVSGNLGHTGGNVVSRGIFSPILPADGSALAERRSQEHAMVDGPFGRMHDPMRSFIDMPGNLIADYILSADDPVKAMFIFGGNPLLSIGGEERMREALGALDLLVCVDIYANATSEYADYILPAAGAFERPDINRTAQGFGETPALQFTEAVVPPAFERRTEWWMLEKLLQCMGLKSSLDDPEAPNPVETMRGFLAHQLAQNGLEADAEKLQGAVQFATEPPEWFYRYVPRVNCFPAELAASIDRMAALFDELVNEAGSTLKLISKRDNNMMNSWYANLPKMKRKERAQNYIFMHPKDAMERQLKDGEIVAIQNANGRIEVPLKLSDDLIPGAVAMTHGWGHARAKGLSFASKTPGTNCNILLPSGPGSFEPVSNQAHMTGITVEITKI